MNMAISKEEAYQIVHDFAQNAVKLVNDRIQAVFLVGSLAEEEYVPGRSDIDTILIVSNFISKDERLKIKELAAKYHADFNIPKGFGCVMITEDEITGCGTPDKELFPEMIRLKNQGKLIWGNFNTEEIRQPTREDFLKYVKEFYSWLRENYIDQQPDDMTFDAKVNTVLYEIRLYVWAKTDEYIFSKRKALYRFMTLASFERNEDLEKVMDYLKSGQYACHLDMDSLLRDISLYVRKEAELF